MDCKSSLGGDNPIFASRRSSGSGRACRLFSLLPFLPFPQKISESAESGVWDSLGGFRWNLRKMEMKLTFMPRSCHEFGQGVSLANAAGPKTLKIFWPPLKKNKRGKENGDRSHSAALNSAHDVSSLALCLSPFPHYSSASSVLGEQSS
jgi:hypothetical protein